MDRSAWQMVWRLLSCIFTLHMMVFGQSPAQQLAQQQQRTSTGQTTGEANGAVSGRVLTTDGTPIAGAKVFLSCGASVGALITVWPTDPGPSGSTRSGHRTDADEGGRFRLDNLPPGGYLMTAWELPAGSRQERQTQAAQLWSALRNASVRQGFRAQAEPATLDEASTFTLTLEPVSAVDLARQLATLP